METSSVMHRSSRISKSKLKSYHHKSKKTITRNNNNLQQTRNGEHHKYHHDLIRSRRVRNGKHLAKLNGNLKFATKFDAKDEKSMVDGNNEGKINKDELLIGNFTREVYNAICLRLGDTLHIPEDSVKVLFNDMHLFPSDTQVTKMLQCARQYSRRNGTSTNFLTFGEFCVFVREMQNHPSPKAHRKTSQPKINNNKCPNNKCEVFLGGSCNPTTWRADTAIPELQKYGISFYNPQVSMWAPELLAQEHDAKQSASVLLFVIDSQTRSTVGMVEVAYLVACGRCVIVVAQPYRIGQTIMGEVITDGEYCDLVQGQKSLLDLIKSKGVQIHTNLSTALHCTAEILRDVSINGTTPEEQVAYKLRRLREVYDSYKGHMRIYDVIDAYRRLTNRSLEISKLYNYFNLQNVNGSSNGVVGNGTTEETPLSFEKFCTVMAELSSDDGCGMCNIEAWATQTFTRNQHTQGSATTPQNRSSNCAVNPTQEATPNLINGKPLYDVYLGGSLSTGTTWREDVAVPLLKENGLQYYNPTIRDQRDSIARENSQDDVSRWRDEIGQCKTALFVITSDRRCLTSMILAAYFIGIGKDVVLSIEQLDGDSCVVADETLTKIAIKDYNRARAYLKDLAERRQVAVFENVTQAVEHIVSKTRVVDKNSTRTELNR
ncbi:unnamed protein product [Ceutorhynchus assimilis]|uniref:Uncharacterized protein n=1 Tax=Ceutorhynchus assimilis TaxID=467358 RepID=A0A9P0GRN5_9CUCU|nr:unnamed protein product [Ceutorhynchus assimilis]